MHDITIDTFSPLKKLAISLPLLNVHPVSQLQRHHSSQEERNCLFGGGETFKGVREKKLLFLYKIQGFLP